MTTSRTNSAQNGESTSGKGGPLQSTNKTKPASIDVNTNSDGTLPPRSYTNTLDQIRHIINYGLNIRQPANPRTDATKHMLWDDSKWLTLIPSIYVSSQNYFMFFYVVDPLTFGEETQCCKKNIILFFLIRSMIFSTKRGL